MTGTTRERETGEGERERVTSNNVTCEQINYTCCLPFSLFLCAFVVDVLSPPTPHFLSVQSAIVQVKVQVKLSLSLTHSLIHQLACCKFP